MVGADLERTWRKRILERASVDAGMRATLVKAGALRDRVVMLEVRGWMELGPALAEIAAQAGLIPTDQVTRPLLSGLMEWLDENVAELAYLVRDRRTLSPGHGYEQPVGRAFLSWTVSLPRERAAMETIKKAFEYFNVQYFDYTLAIENDHDDTAIRQRLHEEVARAAVSIELLSAEIGGSEWIRAERNLIAARPDISRILVCLDLAHAHFMTMTPEQERRAVRLDVSDGRLGVGLVGSKRRWNADAADSSSYRSPRFALQCFELGWRVRRLLDSKRAGEVPAGPRWRPFGKFRSWLEFLGAVEPWLYRLVGEEAAAHARDERQRLAAALVRTLPDNPSVVNNLAAGLRQLGESTWAVALLEDLLERHPDAPYAWTNLGNALRQDGRLTDAVEAFERSLALRPEHALTLNNLGYALWLARRPGEAIPVLRTALRLRPGHAGTLLNLGMALFRQMNQPAAIDVLNHIPRHEPQHAFVLLVNGHADQAVAQLLGLLDSTPPGGVDEWQDDLRALAEAGVRGAAACLAAIEKRTPAGLTSFMSVDDLWKFIDSYLKRLR